MGFLRRGCGARADRDTIRGQNDRQQDSVPRLGRDPQARPTRRAASGSGLRHSDRRCARRDQSSRPGRRNGPLRPKKETGRVDRESPAADEKVQAHGDPWPLKGAASARPCERPLGWETDRRLSERVFLEAANNSRNRGNSTGFTIGPAVQDCNFSSIAFTTKGAMVRWEAFHTLTTPPSAHKPDHKIAAVCAPEGRPYHAAAQATGGQSCTSQIGSQTFRY